MANDKKLTPKQEAFALAYVETGNASEAYRRAYDAHDTPTETVAPAACKLLGIYKITTRVDEIQRQARERSEVSIDAVVARLLIEAGAVEEAIPADTTSPARVSALDKVMKHLGGYERDNEQSRPVMPQTIALVAPDLDDDAKD